MLSIKGSAGVREARFALTDWSRLVADLVPFLEEVLAAFERHADRLFDSEGAAGSGKWAPLSPVTESIREQNGVAGLPILQNTGSLRDALGTTRGRFALRMMTGSGFIYGTNGLHYASFHQTGTKQKGVTLKQQRFLRVAYGIHMKLGHVITMPARPPLDLAGRSNNRGGIAGLHPEVKAEVLAAAREHVVKAARRGGATAVLRGQSAVWREFTSRGFD